MHPPNNPWKSGFLCLFTDRETESQGGSTAGWETERRDSETLTGSRPQVEATAVCPSSALPPLLSASLQVRPREPPTSGFLGSSPPSPSGLAQHVLRKPARASEPELSGPDLPIHRVLFSLWAFLTHPVPNSVLPSFPTYNSSPPVHPPLPIPSSTCLKTLHRPSQLSVPWPLAGHQHS